MRIEVETRNWKLELDSVVWTLVTPKASYAIRRMAHREDYTWFPQSKRVLGFEVVRERQEVAVG